MTTEVLHEGRFLRLIKRRNWEFVERTNAPGVVVIYAVTNENKLVMVEQYRAPVDTLVIELPAGLAGDVPEDAGPDFLVKAAQRELLEETGYQAESLELLATGPSSCGMSNEIINIYIAKGVTKVGKGGGVDDEKIMIHEVPVTEVIGWLAEQQRCGVMVDYKIYSSLLLAQTKGEALGYTV